MSGVTPEVSIIVGTRNRGKALRASIDAIRASGEYSALSWELLVTNSASTDDTGRILSELKGAIPELTVMEVDRPGVSRARNRAIKASQGTAILFTDDDVLVPEDWVRRMAHPILSGEWDIVAGAVHLQDYAYRDRIPFPYTSLLADTGDGLGQPPHTAISASMAVTRVLFDGGLEFPEQLGPGALGCMDDSLLYLQALECHARAVFLADVVVQHCVETQRFTRSELLRRAAIQGRCEAWVHYHWAWGSIAARDIRAALRRPPRSPMVESTIPSLGEFNRTRARATCLELIRSIGRPRAFAEARWVPPKAADLLANRIRTYAD